MRIRAAIAAATILTFAAGAALADEINYAGYLTGATASPATPTHGKGNVLAQLDTESGQLDYTVDFSGLGGPATGAQFVIAGGQTLQASPSGGTLKVSDAQARDLRAGKWSFAVDTAAYPQGEIGARVTRSNSNF